MSLIVTAFDESVIVRSIEAETIGRAPVTLQLLADGSSTGGALSTKRVTLLDGANGPAPHRHARSVEMFYLLDGIAQFLSGDRVVTAQRGDLVVVPSGMDHAFAAAPGEDADILIVATPGIDRFEYFRHMERIAKGELPRESLMDVQELYDTYFTHSDLWNRARLSGWMRPG
ncbi:cupin domain-containing protein [Streptomyces sp. FIT100]|uniref:cupin domain-containing protein n=1 Tax=Streptomyces sp. FIT100 TaxID=2837956 RepID=UPI0021C6806F|nr:cupin domain-containing protein [Streptomyces sp. FIT100]UUN25268.1 cupin domain-containing protein [Streptomyces sp. FIT100]